MTNSYKVVSLVMDIAFVMLLCDVVVLLFGACFALVSLFGSCFAVSHTCFAVWLLFLMRVAKGVVVNSFQTFRAIHVIVCVRHLMCVCVRAHTFTHVHTQTHTRTHTYTHKHTHTHPHVHTSWEALSRSSFVAVMAFVCGQNAHTPHVCEVHGFIRRYMTRS